ncbi:MAG: hypothetical protein JSU98_04210 [Gemmatimonadales bacterium]|nr:MAG: hypothetical protein JSU98_04210 [Gemmatimonadales bacterium]
MKSKERVVEPGSEEARVREVVTQVVTQALRTRSLEGVVVAWPPSPEGALLARWLRPTMSVRVGEPNRVAGLVDAAGGDADAAWLAWGVSTARRDRLLVVHPGHKSLVLLDAPLSPCFPLGDLWAHQLEAWAGATTVPRALAGLGRAAFREVEEALRLGLDEGAGTRTALATLPVETALRVRRSLETGRYAVRPPLIPKLSPWTPGVDPAP